MNRGQLSDALTDRTVPPKPLRDGPIDAMRAVSMLYIVGFWHLFDYARNKSFDHHDETTFRLTVLALGLFVFISGYLTARKDPASSGRLDAVAYYKARFWRIYPPFLIATSLFLLLHIGHSYDLYKGITLVAMFAEPAPPTLWFVSMIVVFYVIAPLLVRLRTNVAGFLALCLSLTLAMMLYEALTGHIDPRIILYFPCFAAGIFLGGRSLITSPLAIAGLVILAAVSLIPTIGRPAAAIERDLMSAPWALFGSVAIFMIVKRYGGAFTTVAVVNYLSVASFWMYLLHRPILKILVQEWFPASGAGQLGYLIMVCLPIVAVAGWITQHAYDAILKKGHQSTAAV